MQIHQLQVERIYESTLDGRTGRIWKQSSERLAAGDATAITFDGEEYRRAQDGSFEVPAEAGDFYTRQDGWFAGANPFAGQIEAENAEAAKAKAAELAAQKRQASREGKAAKAAA